MKSLWFLIFALILPIAACQEQGEQAGTIEETPAVDAATVEQSIRDSSQRFSQAMIAGDIEAVSSFYTDDAIILPQGTPQVQGIDGIRGEFDRMFAAGMKPTAFALNPQTIVVSEAGDLAYEIGTFTWTGPGPDGAEMTDNGKYVAIWKPTATGEWKIAVDAWSSDAMPGAPADITTETATTTEVR
jgi:uncharacterized protein (TIGR02246 family)